MSNAAAPGSRRGPFALLTTLALAACGSGGGAAPAPTATAVVATSLQAAPPNDLGLNAVLDQYRPDEIAHLLLVRLTNHGTTTWHIGSMQLAWPGLTTVAPTPRDTLIVPGQTLDVPIDYGAAVCAGQPPGADEQTPTTPIAAIATVTPAGSTAAQQTIIPVADQLRVLGRIFPSSCRDRARRRRGRDELRGDMDADDDRRGAGDGRHARRAARQAVPRR